MHKTQISQESPDHHPTSPAVNFGTDEEFLTGICHQHQKKKKTTKTETQTETQTQGISLLIQRKDNNIFI